MEELLSIIRSEQKSVAFYILKLVFQVKNMHRRFRIIVYGDLSVSLLLEKHFDF